MRQVQWSEKAIEDYDRNLEYLLDKWTIREEIAFNLQVSKTLQRIVEMPEMYPAAMIGGEIVKGRYHSADYFVLCCLS
jgi:plasmid stabilization system protein ParE